MPALDQVWEPLVRVVRVVRLENARVEGGHAQSLAEGTNSQREEKVQSKFWGRYIFVKINTYLLSLDPLSEPLRGWYVCFL